MKKKNKHLLAAVAGVSALSSLLSSAEAASRIWSGGGTDNNWSTAGNWGGTAPKAGDTLTFGGTIGLNNTNDLTAYSNLNGITFSSGAAPLPSAAMPSPFPPASPTTAPTPRPSTWA